LTELEPILPKRTNQFQQLIYAIHLQIGGVATVTESKFIHDRVTGDEREVDIVIETEAFPYHFTIGIECIGRGRRATVEWIEQMSAKHQNLTDKLVLVSKTGFTRDAIRKAKTLGIETLTLNKAETVDWTKVVGRLTRVYIALPQVWPTHIGIFPPLNASHVDVSSRLYNPEGKSQGSLQEIILALREAQQVIKYIFETFDRPGNFAFGLQYTPLNGSYLIDKAGNKHNVEMLLIQIAVHMDERIPVDLQHGSFKDVQVAYGMLNKFDLQLQGLLTIVETQDKPLSADLQLSPKPRTPLL
jgi:hypothetical protein